MMVEVKKEIEHQKNVLVRLMDDITRGRLTTSFTQQVKTAKRKKEAFEALFLTADKPNFAECITKYLRWPATRKLYEGLQHMAEDEKRILTKTEIKYYSGELGKRLIVQSGHRVNDAYGEGFMMGDFAKVCREGAAIYPYKMVDEGSANCIAEKEMNMLAGKGLLVQQNPLECNPADQDDPRNQNDGQTRQLWEAFQGRCVVWIIIAFALSLHYFSRPKKIFIIISSSIRPVRTTSCLSTSVSSCSST